MNGSSNLIGNLGSSQLRETYSISYPAQGTPNHAKNQLGKESDDEVLMYDKNGNLSIPKPFMPRISPSTAQHATSTDPGFRSGAGEERYAEYDERLIYQAALQVLKWLNLVIKKSLLCQNFFLAERGLVQILNCHF